MCCLSFDVPYTDKETGITVWRTERCWATTMPGSRFCLWHRKDYLPPETCAMRSNAALSEVCRTRDVRINQ